jgi:hypothetical protein
VYREERRNTVCGFSVQKEIGDKKNNGCKANDLFARDSERTFWHCRLLHTCSGHQEGPFHCEGEKSTKIRLFLPKDFSHPLL